MIPVKSQSKGFASLNAELWYLFRNDFIALIRERNKNPIGWVTQDVSENGQSRINLCTSHKSINNINEDAAPHLRTPVSGDSWSTGKR
jgi:hypothetical protein